MELQMWTLLMSKSLSWWALFIYVLNIHYLFFQCYIQIPCYWWWSYRWYPCFEKGLYWLNMWLLFYPQHKHIISVSSLSQTYHMDVIIFSVWISFMIYISVLLICVYHYTCYGLSTWLTIFMLPLSNTYCNRAISIPFLSRFVRIWPRSGHTQANPLLEQVSWIILETFHVGNKIMW